MKRLLLIVLVLALGLMLVAPTMAQSGNILRIAFQQEPDTLSPLYLQLWFAGVAQDLIWAPLWFIDDQLLPYPVLAVEIPSAENGGISADGTQITVTMRDDIFWSDGQPITAGDFVFAYDMIMDPSNTPSSRYPWEGNVTGVTAPDDRTIVINFNAPFAAWVPYVGGLPPLPEHVLRPVFEAEGTLDVAAFNRQPTVSSGPFVLQEWQAASHMSFVRNENYFMGAPKLDGVFIKFVPDDATVVAELTNGDSDMATFIAYNDAQALEQTGTVETELVGSGYNEGWYFNVDPATAHPAMLDVNVRRALVMAFDRDKINQDLNLGLTYTAKSFWEATPYASPNVQPLPYDPAMAAQLLDEAGWVDSDGDGVRDKDGVKLELRYITNQRQIRKDVQAVVQQALGDLGISVVLGNFSTDVYYASYVDGGPLSLGEYDISARSISSAFPDPDTSRFLCSERVSADSPEGLNDQGYCNPALDALFIEQAQTTDPETRIQLFHQIDEIMAQDVIWAGVWYDPDLWSINTRVLNARISGGDPFWNAVNWELAS